MHLHPASLLLAWIALVLAVQLVPDSGLIWFGLMLVPLAAAWVPLRARRLLRRVRYLLLVLRTMLVAQSARKVLRCVLMRSTWATVLL